RVDHALHLIEREDRRDVELHAVVGEATHQRVGRLAARVRHRNFDVDVFAPRGDLARLPLHLLELVGEDFEGEGPVGDGGDDRPGEAAVVGQPRLVHESGVGGEAFDVRLGVHLEHAGFLRAVGEELDLEVFHSFHRVDSHFVSATFSFGCDTNRCHTTAWNASVCGVTFCGFTVGTMTQTSATRAV